MKVEIIKEGHGLRKDQTTRLLKFGDRFFYASRVERALGLDGPECLVFECDRNGSVLNWSEVAGGKFMTLDEATKDLEEKLDNESRKEVR